MSERPDTGIVLHADYTRVEAERDELRAKVSRYEEVIEAAKRWREGFDQADRAVQWRKVQNDDALIAAVDALAHTPNCTRCGGVGYLVDRLHGEPVAYCDCEAATTLATQHEKDGDEAMARALAHTPYIGGENVRPSADVFHWEFCPVCKGNQTTAEFERDRWVLRCHRCNGVFTRADLDAAHTPAQEAK